MGSRSSTSFTEPVTLKVCSTASLAASKVSEARPWAPAVFTLQRWYTWSVAGTEKSNSSGNESISEKLTEFVCVAIFCIPFFLFLYRSDLDRLGWIFHWHTVDVYIQGEWFDGENRVCSGIQTKPDDKSPKEISALHCPPAPFESSGGVSVPSANISTHNLSVVFWGRVSRPGVRSIDEASGARFEWNCTRKEDRFVCHAIN
jgi:hypothetical protein